MSTRSYRRKEPTQEQIFDMRKAQLVHAKKIAAVALKTDEPDIVFEISGYINDDVNADEVLALLETAHRVSLAVFGEEKGSVPATVLGVLDVLTEEDYDDDEE